MHFFSYWCVYFYLFFIQISQVRLSWIYLSPSGQTTITLYPTSTRGTTRLFLSCSAWLVQIFQETVLLQVTVSFTDTLFLGHKISSWYSSVTLWTLINFLINIVCEVKILRFPIKHQLMWRMLVRHGVFFYPNHC